MKFTTYFYRFFGIVFPVIVLGCDMRGGENDALVKAVADSGELHSKAEDSLKPGKDEKEELLSRAKELADNAAKTAIEAQRDEFERAAKAAKEAAEAEVAKKLAEAEAKSREEAMVRAKEELERLEKIRLEEKAEKEKLRLEAKTAEEERKKAISTRTFHLQHADAEEVAAKLNDAWTGDFGAGWKVSKVAQAFPEANAVMVTAPMAILDSCDESIRAIDFEPRQVYVEARFIELSTSASHKLGIDWQMLDGMRTSLALNAGLNKRKLEGVSTYNSKDGTYTMDTSNPGKSSANLSHVNATLGMDELAITLRALESTDEARVFSNPKIIVASGRRATVDMTTKYPNVKIAAKRTTNTGGDSLDLDMQMAAIPGEDKMMFAKEAFFSWGISLDVTPRVGTNGLISVQIVPTISEQKDWVSSGASSANSSDEKPTSVSAKYPVIDVQRLVTNFDMASGTTAVIGGLSKTVETQQDSGIPFLRNIWWIGPKLFGSKVRVKEQREIIVFVTVGLVEPNDMHKDAGLPKNAVLGRQYTEDIRREPGDRKRQRADGLKSLDMRPLEEQYADPRRTNHVQSSSWSFKDMPKPFTKDPNYKKQQNNITTNEITNTRK